MFDPFPSDPELRERTVKVIDYRNGKYQGATRGHTQIREGTGIILDHNYLVAAGQWRNGRIEGPALICFPDNTTMHGSIRDTFPSNLCCYHTNKDAVLYCKIDHRNDSLFVLDQTSSKTLLFLSLKSKLMANICQSPTANEQILVQQFKSPSGGERLIRVLQEKTYSSESDKWSIIQSYFKMDIGREYADQLSFAKHHFQTMVDDQAGALEIVQGKEEWQIGYTRSAITCRIATQAGKIRVKFAGYSNERQNAMEISRKWDLQSGQIMELCEGKTISYSERPLQRPIQCSLRLQNYFKKSLAFTNQFLEIDYLYRIKFIFSAIEEFVNQFATNWYAQKLLEEVPPPAPAKRHKDEVVEKTTHPIARFRKSNERVLTEEDEKRVSLEKIREDIYRAAKTKGAPINRSFSFKLPQNQSINENNHSHKKVDREIIKSQSQHEHLVNSSYLQSPLRRGRNSEEKVQLNMSNPTAKRSYAYLDNSKYDKSLNVQNTQTVFPNKYSYAEEGKPAAREKSRSPLSKYAYLEKQLKEVGKKRTENLITLTEYYEQIAKQLKKEELSSSRASKYEPKTASKQSRYTPGPQGRRQSYTPITNAVNDPAALGPRKALKFGWT